MKNSGGDLARREWERTQREQSLVNERRAAAFVQSVAEHQMQFYSRHQYELLFLHSVAASDSLDAVSAKFSIGGLGEDAYTYGVSRHPGVINRPLVSGQAVNEQSTVLIGSRQYRARECPDFDTDDRRSRMVRLFAEIKVRGEAKEIDGRWCVSVNPWQLKAFHELHGDTGLPIMLSFFETTTETLVWLPRAAICQPFKHGCAWWIVLPITKPKRFPVPRKWFTENVHAVLDDDGDVI